MKITDQHGLTQSIHRQAAVPCRRHVCDMTSNPAAGGVEGLIHRLGTRLRHDKPHRITPFFWPAAGFDPPAMPACNAHRATRACNTKGRPGWTSRVMHEDVPAFSRTRGFNVAIAMLFTPLLAD